ncbi:MAG: zinc-ribbon domain-containing protein [Thermodesulfobacteriota bacterium]|nr:zinc-ribbon domain-containing protein [Thermodesulfobacteriota bacterium]
MNIQCPNCKTEYRVDDARIPAKGVYSRCKKCQTKFFVQKETPPASKQQSKWIECPECGLSQSPAQICKHCGAAIPVSTGSATEQKKDKAEIKPPAQKEDISAEKKEKLPPESDISDQEKMVDHYVEQGDQENAAKVLLEMITASSKENDFTRAEKLREKLYEVAPMALNEIVRSGEIIEEEKSKAMDENFIQTYAKLFETLTKDEANALYFAMKRKAIKAGQPVFEQGQIDSNIYFIKSGRLQMVYYDRFGLQEAVLKELTPGNLANDGAFFSFTVCTTSLVAITDAEVFFLEKNILTEWEKNQPGIENKLRVFSNSFESVGELIQKSGLQLRGHKRVKFSSNALVQPLDQLGKPLRRPYKVSLFDISAGGISYGFKINKKEDASQLLDSWINIQTIYQNQSGKHKINCNGKIVAVHLQPFDESSVHVQFEELLNEQIIVDIGREALPAG